MTVGDVIWFLEIRDVILRDVILQICHTTNLFVHIYVSTHTKCHCVSRLFFHPGALLFVHGDVFSWTTEYLYVESVVSEVFMCRGMNLCSYGNICRVESAL